VKQNRKQSQCDSGTEQLQQTTLAAHENPLCHARATVSDSHDFSEVPFWIPDQNRFGNDNLQILHSSNRERTAPYYVGY